MTDHTPHPGSSARRPGRRSAAAMIMVWLLASAAVSAQSEHIHPTTPDTRTWTLFWDGNVFAGWNYQQRKFRDFQKVESQNWVMGGAERSLGSGRLNMHVMLSFEPFTIQPLGSPQVFQTGETYRQAPSMHRPSAAENPATPLGHHQMDATHITHGVVTAGGRNGRLAGRLGEREPGARLRTASERTYAVRRDWPG